MKLGGSESLKFIMSVSIPFLIMAYVQTHNPIILGLAFGLVAINIAQPFVLFPSVFVTSLSTEYFITSGGSSLTPIFLLVYILSLCISTKPLEYRRGGKTLIFIMVLIIYNLLSSLFSVTGSFEAFFLMIFYFPIIFFMSIKRNVDVGFVYRTISVTCLIFSLFLIYSFLTGGMEMAVGNDSENRLTFGDINANRYGMLCAPVAAVLIFSFFYESNLIYRLVCLFGSFLTIFVIILTGSRSALYAVIGSTVFALWYFVLRNTKSKGKFAMIAVLAAALIIGFNYLSNADLLVLERFQIDSLMEAGGSGRTNRAEYLFTNVFPNHPLFGIGLGGDNEYAVSEGPCHNILLDPIIQLGIVGFLLYWGFLLPYIFKCIKGVRKNPLVVFPLMLFVTVFLHGMGEVVFFERHFWIIISLCVLFSNNYKTDSVLCRKQLPRVPSVTGNLVKA